MERGLGYIPQSLVSQARMDHAGTKIMRLESIPKVFMKALFSRETAQEGSELPVSLIIGGNDRICS
jgi:hypothetical protein